MNELVEAKQNNQVRRLMSRWQKYELIALDEVGYVPLADIGAEFLFQVISDRAERAAIIVTTNLPFSEWTTVFPNPRLCKALLDRITDRAHISSRPERSRSDSGARWKGGRRSLSGLRHIRGLSGRNAPAQEQNQNLSEKEKQNTRSRPIGASRWSAACRRLTNEAKYQ